jgi:hypothetical protein
MKQIKAELQLIFILTWSVYYYIKYNLFKKFGMSKWNGKWLFNPNKLREKLHNWSLKKKKKLYILWKTKPHPWTTYCHHYVEYLRSILRTENVEVNCLGAAFERKLFGKDKNANPCVSLHATFLKICCDKWRIELF